MFFRKNKTKEVLQLSKQEETVIVNKDELIREADSMSKTIDSVSGEDRIKLLNRIASLYFQTGKIDDAIYYYEISVDENKCLGKAYSDLVKLYNIKRKEAVSKKDNEKMKYYMDKTDNILQLTKDVIRGRI